MSRMHILFACTAVFCLGCGEKSENPDPERRDQGPVFRGKPAAFWIDQLNDRDPGMRQEAMGALGELGPTNSKVIPAILKSLSTETSLECGQAALRVLVRFARQDERVMESILKDLFPSPEFVSFRGYSVANFLRQQNLHDFPVELSGHVLAGSIRKDLQGNRVTFKLADGEESGAELETVYLALTLPDIFMDDAEVNVQGFLNSRSSVFQALGVDCRVPTERLIRAAERKATKQQGR